MTNDTNRRASAIDRCDECGGEIVDTAAGRECVDCHKRFRPTRADGGTDTEQIGVLCAGCNDHISLADIQHIRRGMGYFKPCAIERFGEGVA